MKSLIFYVSVFYDLCKCLLFRFMGGFLLLTRLNEHIICRLISLIVFRLQGVVRFLPSRNAVFEAIPASRRTIVIRRRRQSGDFTVGGLASRRTYFPVAPSETLYVRCRLRVPTPSSDGLAAAAKNSRFRTDPPDFTASRRSASAP